MLDGRYRRLLTFARQHRSVDAGIHLVHCFAMTSVIVGLQRCGLQGFLASTGGDSPCHPYGRLFNAES